MPDQLPGPMRSALTRCGVRSERRRSSPSDHNAVMQLVGSAFGRRAFLVAVWTANFILVAIMAYGFFVSDAGYDWLIYQEAGRRVFEGGLYAWEGIYAWSYSPLLAYVFAALTPIGFAGWSAAHVLAALALGDRWLTVVTLVSFPFWADVYNGNTMVFVFVAAAWAIRGSAWGTVAYLILCVLMPRPLMVPVLAWILWKRPESRLWFLGLAVTSLAITIGTGHAVAWLDSLVGVPEAVQATSRDIGPSRLIGMAWWIPAAILAVVLTLRGKVGWASLAASPYWLPQYFLMPMLELFGDRRKGSGRPTRPSADSE
jgi:hypothetical protein